MTDDHATQAPVDFGCLEADCGETIQFDLLQLSANKGRVSCSNCHRSYEFDRAFIAKLEKLRQLIAAVREAEDILGDADISVTTPAGEVKVPYRLLMTRLTTLISLTVDGRTVDFHFRVEPLDDDETFR